MAGVLDACGEADGGAGLPGDGAGVLGGAGVAELAVAAGVAGCCDCGPFAEVPAVVVQAAVIAAVQQKIAVATARRAAGDVMAGTPCGGAAGGAAAADRCRSARPRHAV